MGRLTYSVGFDHETALECIGTYKKNSVPIDLEAADIGGLPSRRTSSVTLIARTPTDLRRALTIDDQLPAAKSVTLVLDGVPSWRHPPLPAPGDETLWQHLVAISARLDEARRWVVTSRFSAHVPSGEVLSSISRMLDGYGVRGIGPLAGPTGPGTVTEPAPHLPGIEKPSVHLSRDDLRGVSALRDLGKSDGPDGGEAGKCRIAARDTEFLLDLIPPVDERSINPIGFIRNPEHGIGELQACSDGYYVSVANQRLFRLPKSGAVTDVDIERLRSLRGVRGALSGRAVYDSGLARLVIGLAAAGVPLVGEPADGWAQILGEEPVRLIKSATEDDLADKLKREQHSIRLRRWALRNHGIRTYWQRLMNVRGVSVMSEPLVSVLICTRRIAMIESALRQVARQQNVRLELILTLHGLSEDDHRIKQAIDKFQGALKVVEVDAPVSFGEALNRGAAHASGSFIARMDDDDWYGKDYLSDALLAHQYSGADLIGCCGSFAYLEGLNVTIHKESPEHISETPNWMAKERVDPGMYVIVPGATIFVSRTAFEAVGGFRPVHIFEDTEFTRCIAAAGGRIHRTHGLNFMFRRREAKEHTWQEPLSDFLQDDSVCWPGRYFNDLMGIAEGEEP